MKKALIFIFVLLFSFSCNTNDSNKDIIIDKTSGYIAFIHIGEQDKPIDPFIIAVKGDTTHLKYKTYESFSFYSVFTYGTGYMPRNIEFIDDSLYIGIRKYLLDYHFSNQDIKSTGNIGSFLIVIDDTSDSLQFEMPSGEASILCLDSISIIAENDSISKIAERMKYYQDLQR